jgi:hypothetical protein
MRTRVLLAIAFGSLLTFGVGSVGPALEHDAYGARREDVVAQAAGGQSAGPDAVLPELEALAGSSIAAATNAPDEGYTPTPVSRSFPDGSEEGNTRLTNGVLVSEIVLSAGGARSVATVNAQVCPDGEGRVSAHIKMTVGSADGDDRLIEARASGTSNDSAQLTSPSVNVGSAKGSEAKLLRQTGLAILRAAEGAWRGGLCVKIEVSAGQSGVVKPKEKLPISATARARSGGGEIKGNMTARVTGGQKKVSPASASGAPAKFTYTAPDRRPESGSVELRSVSKRGIGTEHLEYTTAGDLKVEGDIGVPPAHISTVKCDGPAGAWTVAYTQPAANSVGKITFTLDESTLSGTWSASGTANGRASSNNGTVTYAASPDGKSGTLTFSLLGPAPVTVGSFCKNGSPAG